MFGSSVNEKFQKLTEKNPAEEIEKADYLRRLANELRLSGYLLQALETFRRALVLNPRSAWLLFDFARCLYSFAGAEHNEKMEKKALAALRLAEKRAGNDGELLARLGEIYFQYGDWRRARRAFQKALEAAGESFRSVRGLAEIALREGKVAHVIHQFSTANRLAETSALGVGRNMNPNIFRGSTTTKTIWNWKSAASICSKHWNTRNRRRCESLCFGFRQF